MKSRVIERVVPPALSAGCAGIAGIRSSNVWYAGSVDSCAVDGPVGLGGILIGAPPSELLSSHVVADAPPSDSSSS